MRDFFKEMVKEMSLDRGQGKPIATAERQARETTETTTIEMWSGEPFSLGLS